jgi:hypothetical protein
VIRGLSPISIVAVLGLAVAACGGAPATAAPSGAAGPPLPAGTYTSTAFTPAVTYTLPAGWEKAADGGSFFEVRPAGSEVSGIYLYSNPQAASQDPSCPAKPEPGVGKTSSELVAWIRQLPGLTVSNPAMVTVGGLPGVSIDAGIKSGWTQSCSFANGSPTVPLFNGGAADYHWVVYGDERLRLYLLDLPGGGTLVINVDTVDATQVDQLIAQALPIIKSMSFAPAPASAAPAPASGAPAPASPSPAAS